MWKDLRTTAISEDIWSRAVVGGNGEIYWPYSDVSDVLKAIASSGRVILGFDFLEFLDQAGQRVTVHGTSGYEVGPRFVAESWPAYCERSLRLALNDLARTRELTGLSAPFDDLWCTVVVGENNPYM